MAEVTALSLMFLLALALLFFSWSGGQLQERGRFWTLPTPLRFFCYTAMVLLPVGMLAIGLIWLLDASKQLQILAAIIAASVIVGGWLVAGLIARDHISAQRSDEQKDILRALRAEIRIYLDTQCRFDPVDYGQRLDTLIEQAGKKGEKYQPFLNSPSEPTVFVGLTSYVRLLPENAVDDVVLFYSQLSEARTLGDRLQSDFFRSLDIKRRHPAYRHYFAILVELKRTAELSVRKISSELKEDAGPYLPQSLKQAQPISRTAQAQPVPAADAPRDLLHRSDPNT